MVGLQVAPTQPKEIDWRSSSGSAESFHRTVGVVRVAVRMTNSSASAAIASRSRSFAMNAGIAS